jgi:hypothetical protein
MTALAFIAGVAVQPLARRLAGDPAPAASEAAELASRWQD